MANYTAINNVYNYYLTTYAPKTDSKFDTHKKSELRSVYNSIVKMNKEAPLYIVDKSQDTKEYVIGLKENARSFHNIIAGLGGLEEESLLEKKVAYSSDESLASVRYIGENLDGEGVPSFEIEVSRLATNQVNTGVALKPGEIGLPADTYSFDVAINGLNYEFQYAVTPEDTNRSVQEKLSRLISNAGIGLLAHTSFDGAGNSSLVIESKSTGTPSNGQHLFSVSDDSTSKRAGSVAYFGLDRVTVEASNSEFLLNGMERQAGSNTFTVEKMYEVTINRVSNGETDKALIDLKADVESYLVNSEEFIEGYNAFIDNANAYSVNHPKSGRLVREMGNIAGIYSERLGEIGINVSEDGHISVDRDALSVAVSEGNPAEKLDILKKFAATMLRKIDEVALNPMEYAERTVVAYKNPGHNYSSPYAPSAYTGLMFNSYC